jgi:hypothetical protein
MARTFNLLEEVRIDDQFIDLIEAASKLYMIFSH